MGQRRFARSGLGKTTEKGFQTFTAWCNSHLRKAGTAIEVIEEDFQSGLKLMLLLEVISGESLKKPDRGKMRFHKIANVNKALQYIESKGVKLVSIGAEEIVDGNVKMTLGLIWTIILRFAIQDINVGELSARDGLLLWCQRKTAPYSNVKISNFSTSWKDGLAFCALIHRHRPELINYHQLNNNNPIKNLNLAFDVAEKYLDIPKMLDAEVMVNTLVPDEKTIMTYISSYYYCFLDMNKAETAANRICRVLNMDRENKMLMEEYETLSTDLLNWIHRKHAKKLNVFKRYRTEEKSSRIDEKSRIEALFNTLQTKLRLNNRPAFLPQHRHLIKDISSAWLDLEQCEKGFEEWLMTEMIRLEHTEKLAKKFYQKCELHKEWINGKEEAMKSTDFKNLDSCKTKALQKRHEIFQLDITAHQDRVDQIYAIAKELHNLHYSQTDAVNKKCEEIDEEWKRIKYISADRRLNLERHQRVAKELDNLHLNFANCAAPFITWTAESGAVCTVIIGHSVQIIKTQIEEIVDEHELSKKLLNNSYTDLDIHTILNKWWDLQSLIPTRENQLLEEKSKQQKIQQLQETFADKAETLGIWLDKQSQQVSNIEMGEQGNLESAVKQLKDIFISSKVEKSNFEALEKINEDLQENFASNSSSNTKYSMEHVRLSWQFLMSSINRVINQCENQMLFRDSKGITEEQLNEYRLSFNHFDKERKGLDEDQLRACLISIGYIRSIDKQDIGQEISDKNMKR
uniref:Calponin-homology (CH) domain-containing protein n=1 Tax=Ditylenchus dipsaci TaxID=166011 RepID=A0A915DJ25_9BILA